jgi:O-antigen/teichoic acid export membrane protein
MVQIRSITATFAAKVGSAMLGLLASVIVARSLGPEGRGSLAAATTLAAIGMQFGNLGLHASNTYYIARDRSQLPAIFANLIVAAVSFGAVAAVVLAVVSRATGMTNQMSAGLIGLALLWIPFGLAYILLANLLLGLHAVARFNQIEIGLKVATLLLTLAMLYFKAADATSFFAGGFVAQLLALMAVWVSLERRASSIA